MNKGEVKLLVQREVNDCMEDILNFAQCAVAETNWKALRSKILRSCNDCVRNLCSQINEMED